jgi:Transposase DDE domain
MPTDRVERPLSRVRLFLSCTARAAYTAYGTGRFLAWVVAKGIAPHIPAWDHSHRTDGTFSRDDFKFDKERDIYVCPTGKVLKSTGRVLTGQILRYRASTHDCGPCPLKSKCCPNTPQRMVPRDVNEDSRDHVRALEGPPAFEKSRNKRKKVEMRFAAT